ncbi:MAG: hypothetical protein M9931_03860 [Chitinophagales bacterium]|nr:hypothetical protein [Chitinophagales bacterium]
MKASYIKNTARFILPIVLCFFTRNLLAQVESFAVEHQCIIQLKNDSSLESVLQNISDAVVKETLSRSMNIFLIEKRKGNFSSEEIQLISNQKNVIAAQYNHKVERRSFALNDTYFRSNGT